MQGDFTRLLFDPRNHYRQVLQQQGRVPLDAESNEQSSILLYYLQTLAADIIGPCGGPADNCGFDIGSIGSGDFTIGKGRYYVDGVLVENDDDSVTYLNQRDLPGLIQLNNNIYYVVYLDVWERHITYIEDDLIREVALGGPDTTTRAKVVWQVKTLNIGSERQTLIQFIRAIDKKNIKSFCELVRQFILYQMEQKPKPSLRARAKIVNADVEPCAIHPDARYRGAENQLYRVEIHTPGALATAKPTFKWSRENASVIFPILDISPDSQKKTTTIALANLGRDARLSLSVGDWVEIVYDDYVLNNHADPLLQVAAVDRIEMKVTLSGIAKIDTAQQADITSEHPFLRRWDQQADPKTGGLTLNDTDNCALIVEGTGDDNTQWLTLEDGVQIQFQPNGTYRTGDYWLIPARTATGDVEWPQETDANGNLSPKSVFPRGIEHHYAPLAIIFVGTTKLNNPIDCRCQFPAAAVCIGSKGLISNDTVSSPAPAPSKPLKSNVRVRKPKNR